MCLAYQIICYLSTFLDVDVDVDVYIEVSSFCSYMNVYICVMDTYRILSHWGM